MANTMPDLWLFLFNVHYIITCYFALSRGARHFDQYVSLSVCLYVCSRAYLKNHTVKFHQIFCTCYL